MHASFSTAVLQKTNQACHVCNCLFDAVDMLMFLIASIRHIDDHNNLSDPMQIKAQQLFTCLFAAVYELWLSGQLVCHCPALVLQLQQMWRPPFPFGLWVQLLARFDSIGHPVSVTI